MTKDDRIYAAIETLLANWEHWEAEAGQQAQQDQDPLSYRDTMYGFLYPLFDELVSPKAPPPLCRTAPLVGSLAGWQALATTDQRLALREGDVVAVRMDDGSVRRFTVRVSPWWLPHDTGVIGLHGVPGGYDLDRVVARRSA